MTESESLYIDSIAKNVNALEQKLNSLKTQISILDFYLINAIEIFREKLNISSDDLAKYFDEKFEELKQNVPATGTSEGRTEE